MAKTNGKDGTVDQVDAKRPICGIVMPISSIDGCNESHWLEVRAILLESIEAGGFEANLVSDAEEIQIIQKTIIQNLYDNPIVVCDVSGRNPNVMFELGLRLAFDKPTIIVKDTATSYSFDTSVIEHLEYPRDLRYAAIQEFKKRLSEKVSKTHERATKDPSYTTFLKNFGEFKVAKIDQKEVSGDELILERLDILQNTVLSMRTASRSPSLSPPRPVLEAVTFVTFCFDAEDEKDLTNRIIDLNKTFPGVNTFSHVRHGDHFRVTMYLPKHTNFSKNWRSMIDQDLLPGMISDCSLKTELSE